MSPEGIINIKPNVDILPLKTRHGKERLKGNQRQRELLFFMTSALSCLTNPHTYIFKTM